MSNWKLINKTYVYDGSFDGLLSTIFKCYFEKTLPQKLYSKNNYIENFLDKTEFIKTDYEKSKRIFDAIPKLISIETLKNIYYAFLSNDKEKDINILNYICNGFDIGPEINNKIVLSYVFKTISLRKKVLSECHKLKGLLRFQEIGENFCYSKINPDNLILEPLRTTLYKKTS